MTQAIPDLPDECWPIDDSSLPDTWGNLDPDVQDRAIAAATATLRRLTLGRVGGCPITVRPCRSADITQIPSGYYGAYGAPAYGPNGMAAPWVPFIDRNGGWVNCTCLEGCGCTTGCQVELIGIVGRVDEIKVDGVVIPSTDYRLDGNTIVYQGTDTCPFPKSQDLSKPAGEVGTFTVTYLPAYPVDGWGSYVAAVLANEFAAGATGGKCRLPSGVTQIVRQGVSMTITSGAFPGGLTGIREVDTYITHFNPAALRVPPRVYSPDLP